VIRPQGAFVPRTFHEEDRLFPNAAKKGRRQNPPAALSWGGRGCSPISIGPADGQKGSFHDAVKLTKARAKPLSIFRDHLWLSVNRGGQSDGANPVIRRLDRLRFVELLASRSRSSGITSFSG